MKNDEMRPGNVNMAGVDMALETRKSIDSSESYSTWMRIFQQTPDLIVAIALYLDQHCPADEQRAGAVAVQTLDPDFLVPAGAT